MDPSRRRAPLRFEPSLPRVVPRMKQGESLIGYLSERGVIRGRVWLQWLFHAQQAAHVGHELLQALEEGDLLLAVHGGRRAARCQLVEGVGQSLVDDGVSLRGEQSLHQLRVLRLTEEG